MRIQRKNSAFALLPACLLAAGLLVPAAVSAAEETVPPRGAGPDAAGEPAALPAPLSREDRLDLLYEALAASEDPIEARVLEQQIMALWHESGSPTADLLVGEGSRLMNEGDLAHAMELFYAAIELKPDFAEAWNKRATLYYLLEEYELALADIERVLELEPRHFGALSGRGLIMDELGREEDAYQAFRRALAVNPYLPAARARVEALTPVVRGRRI